MFARGLLLVVVALLVGAAPASAAFVINEVESDGAGGDFIEVMNTGPGSANLGGYVLKDNNDGNTFTIPNPTNVAAGDYYTGYVGFGLGSSDAARLFTPGAVLLDSYTWTAHAAATYGRCPDGTGAMTWTVAPTPGAANSCPGAATAWPGGTDVATADDAGVFGSNLSGLVYQGSGSAAKGVLWAVRNNPSTLFRLVWDGARWTPDTAGGWAAGKTLFYPNGAGVPDAEGVTLGADAGAVYVSTERNDDGVNSSTSRPAVLRYDVTGAGATLTATNDWNLSADLPGLPANAGLEAVAWVPDSLLVAKGFTDEATGRAYDPARYANHGGGLFFVGVENDGRIIAYALNSADNTFTRVAEIASGFPQIMDLSYDPETTHLWAVCDDNCNGRTEVLDVGAGGRFAVTAAYDRPAGMANLNNEGFAIAAQSECSGGSKPVFWSDDSNDAGHALRSGTIACTPLAPPAPGGGGSGGGGSGGGGGGGGTTPGTSPIPIFGPVPLVRDTRAPSVRLALRLTKTERYAVRRSGRFALTLTLGERADLTLTVKARARTLLRTTRRGVAAGRKTFVLRLSTRVRRALRRGTTITVTLVARDAAGNKTTKKVSAKVP